jgi:hypothetical protein
MTFQPAAVDGERAFAGSAVSPGELLDRPEFGAVMVVSARQYLSPLGEVVHTVKPLMSGIARQAL